MTKLSPKTPLRFSLARSWLIVSTAGFFYFFQLVLQALPSVIRDGLVVDFSLSQAGFGGLSSSFYYPYILLQVPAGLLVLRFGARMLLIGGIILCTLACFLTAYSRDLFWVEVARILMGLGSAPTFVCTATLATRWFPPTMLPILIALIETLGMLGPALGQEVLGWIVQTSGWRTGMLACGWFGLLLFGMIVLLVRNSPAAENSSGNVRPSPSALELAKILFSLRLILVGLVGGMIYSAGLALAMLWGVSFFELHMSLVQASFCASFFLVGNRHRASAVWLGMWSRGRTTPAPGIRSHHDRHLRCSDLVWTGHLPCFLSGNVLLRSCQRILRAHLCRSGFLDAARIHECRLWFCEYGYPRSGWPVVSAIDWDPCTNARAGCARCRLS